MNTSASLPVYAVIIPFYNEEGAVPGLLAALREVMDGLNTPYEVLLIDDGSTDGTAAALTAHAWPAARVLTDGINQGQAAALLSGFHAARGTWIITLDGDGQNDPADIPALIATAARGYDMVVGIRVTRQDSWLRRSMSRLANAVRGNLLNDHLCDSGCALKVFRREIVASFWPIR